MGAGELKKMRCERTNVPWKVTGTGVIVRLRPDGRRERGQALRGSRKTLSSTGWRETRGLASLAVLGSVDMLAASGQARPPSSQRPRHSGQHPIPRRRALRRPICAEMVPDLGDIARKVKILCIRTHHPSA